MRTNGTLQLFPLLRIAVCLALGVCVGYEVSASVMPWMWFGMMVASGIIVMLMLAILMASTIRKQYRELGIMKSLGYTSKELMFQMAFRIIPVAFLAVVMGTLLSFPLLGVVGAIVCEIEVSIVGVIITDLAILTFCFGSAYLNARKIEKISAYELITE